MFEQLTPLLAYVGVLVPVEGKMVIKELADLVVSATDVAVSVTADAGTLAGAVNVTGFAVGLGESDPQLPVQLRLHVTPLFMGSFCTVAVKFDV